MKTFLKLSLLFVFLLTACGQATSSGAPLELASSTENLVQVDITLELDSAGQVWLAASFTTQGTDTHLYSKDLPRDGVNGLGRPTLLELPLGSQLRAAGSLTESVPANEQDIDGLQVYPAGPVTLRLPVSLPPGGGWFDESVSVTYMACTSGSCYPPVIGKLIPVRIPGVETFLNP